MKIYFLVAILFLGPYAALADEDPANPILARASTPTSGTEHRAQDGVSCLADWLQSNRVGCDQNGKCIGDSSDGSSKNGRVVK